MPQGREVSVEDLIRQEADKAGVPAELALAVAEQESSFNPGALGPEIAEGSAKGQRAIGTFQIVPSTGKMLGIDPNDPVQNIQGGIKYLRQLLDQHQGDTSKVLATYGGVVHDQTYVPAVLARMQRFSGQKASVTRAAPPPTVPPPSAGGPPSTGGRGVGPGPQRAATTITPDAPFPGSGVVDAALNSFNPMRPEGRRNLAGTVGSIAAGTLLGGPPGAAVGAIRGLATGVGGAAVGGGLEQAAEDVAHGGPPSLENVAGAAIEQGGAQLAGAAVAWPFKAVGKRLLAGPVRRSAEAGLKAEEQALATDRAAFSGQLQTLLTNASESLQRAKDRFKGATAPVSRAQAGREVATTIAGPAKAAKSTAGELVEQTAASGPPVNLGAVKAKYLAAQQATVPDTAADALGGVIGAESRKLMAERSPALLQQLNDLQLQANHPIKGVVSEIANLPDEISFRDAHLWKRKLDEAVNWDQTAKKQVEGATKGVRQALRQAMTDAGNQPYEEATAAYEHIAKLHGKGIAPKLLKQAYNNPESITDLLNPRKPSEAQFLKELLTEQAEAGGGKQQGQRAWDAVRAAYTQDKILSKGVEKLDDVVAKMDPEFVEVVYGDASGKQVLKNLQTISGAYKQATQRVTELEATIKGAKAPTPAELKLQDTRKAFQTSTLGKAEGPLEAGADIAQAAAIGTHSYFAWRALLRALKGPSGKDLAQWASYSPAWTQVLVNAVKNPNSTAFSTLVRMPNLPATVAETLGGLMAEHGQGGPPPGPARAQGAGPAGGPPPVPRR